MPPKPKEESANLIRVRNNQRRSRQRRREYVAELERKLQNCKAKGPPACMREVVPEHTMHKLEEDNRKLRQLLDLVGVKQALVDAHVGAVAEVAGRQSLAHNPEKAAEGRMCCTGDCSLEVNTLPDTVYGEAGMSQSTEKLLAMEGQCDSEDLLAASFLHLPDDDFDFSFDQATSYFDPSPISQSYDEPSLQFPDHTAQLPCPTAAGPPPCCPDESHLPPPSRSESEMTLCSVAYEMIRQQNKRGVDMIEIGIRLWNGFVKGEGGSGCKVENDLLYSVLEYIKG